MNLTSNILPILATTASAPEMMGIRDIIRDSYWSKNQNWLIPTILVGTLLLIYIVYRICKRPPAPPPSPYELAQKRLNEVRQEMVNLDDKKFSSRLSLALRQYIEASFGLRAPEQTTEEFLKAAQSDHKISESALQSLEAFLKLCDLAKFAQHQLQIDDKNKLWDTAQQFIEESEPDPIATDGKPSI